MQYIEGQYFMYTIRKRTHFPFSPAKHGKIIIIIIIIIIQRGLQCKAEREWYTPYQTEDPSHTIPTYKLK